MSGNEKHSDVEDEKNEVEIIEFDPVSDDEKKSSSNNTSKRISIIDQQAMLAMSENMASDEK